MSGIIFLLALWIGFGAGWWLTRRSYATKIYWLEELLASKEEQLAVREERLRLAQGRTE